MKMLTVRLSLSIEEFEGGNEVFEQVDCWFVDRGYPPLSSLDDGSDVAHFEGECREDDLDALETLLAALPWRVREAVVLQRALERVTA